MEQVKRKDETLYIGSDFTRAYEIKGDINLANAKAVCKIRDKNDEFLIEANTSIQDNRIYINISSEASLKMPRDIKQGKYDIFIIGDTYIYKIMMGSITFIPDVSMH